MRLSKIGYYADFVVYPAIAAGAATFAAAHGDWRHLGQWTLACGAGIAGWTLVEYGMHRLVLHHIPFFEQLHDLHHSSPTASVGTPTWLSAAIVGLTFLVLWFAVGPDLAAGLTTGLVLGYIWYITVHHAVHHWRLRYGSYLYRAKLEHSQHHHFVPECNFGVTTRFWDHVFGTAKVVPARRGAQG